MENTKMVGENNIKHVLIHISHTYKTIKEFKLWDIDNEQLKFWHPFLKIQPEHSYLNIFFTRKDSSKAVDTEVFIQKFCAKLEKEIYKFKKKRIIITAEINYSSLDLNLLFEPLSNLVETFDNNFEFFEAFLNQYVPIAFTESVINVPIADFPGTYLDDTFLSDIYRNLNYEYQISHSTHGAFLAAPTATPQVAKTINWAPANKAKWAWIAANTSLVVPSLLAAVYFWWASEDQKDRYNAHNMTSQGLLEQQNQLIESCYKILSAGSKKQATTTPSKIGSSITSSSQP